MNALEKSQVLFKELESLRPLSPEDEQRIMQKFRLDWNYHSNHLEGNQLTFGETKALILFNITAQGKPLKDYIEMRGHNEAIELIIDIIKENRPLTEAFIGELHKLLLDKPYWVDAETPEGKPTKKLIQVGRYKETPNHVRTQTGEIFYFATPEETPAKMHDLLQWYRGELEKKEKNAILLAAEFHYRFIRIHPFDDGNGRLARILMNFILMSYRYPPVVIKTEDKENYFAVLRLADAGQLEPFVTYITENLNHSLELMIKGAKGESVEEEDDLEKEIALLQGKLNEVGPKIKTVKSLESITQFIQNNLPQLFEEFNSKNQLFKEYYFRHDYILYIGERRAAYPNQIPQVRNVNFGLKTDTKSFSIISYHHVFKTSGLEDLNFEGRIDISFKATKVEVSSNYPESGSKKVSKRYGESLSQSEIKNTIRPIIEAHKEKIEERISKAKQP